MSVKELIFRDSKTKVEVECYTVVRSIGDVDSVKGTFRCLTEVWCWLWLTETEYLDRKSDPKSWTPSSLPYPSAYNGIDVVIEPILNANGINHHVRRLKDNKCKVLVGWNLNAVFFSHLDLRNFPLDKQELVVDIMFSNYNDMEEEKTEFIFNWVDPRFAKFFVFQDPVWELYSGINAIKRTKHVDPRHYELRMYLSRNPNYYWTRICARQGILSSMSMLVFLFGEDSFVDRMNYIVSLIFATIAFLFVVEADMPKLSYTTLLDEYIYFTFAVYILQSALCVCSNFWYEEYDFHFLVASFSAFILIHIIFFIQIHRRNEISSKWLDERMNGLVVHDRGFKEFTYSEKQFAIVESAAPKESKESLVSASASTGSCPQLPVKTKTDMKMKESESS
jgi:hypothetical protein